jgi:hypothetical protein
MASRDGMTDDAAGLGNFAFAGHARVQVPDPQDLIGADLPAPLRSPAFADQRLPLPHVGEAAHDEPAADIL